MDNQVSDDKFRDALREHVLHLVNENAGMKTAELETEIWQKLLKKDSDLNKAMKEIGIQALVEELVNLKKVIEVEYILPSGALKSFYLPAKTQVNIRGQENKTVRI